MSTGTQKAERNRAERLIKRREALMEAVRKDIQLLKKIVAISSETTKPKPTK